jgi:hypothetical protein
MGAGGHFCLNCRYRWREPVDPETSASTSFSDVELARLAVYRQAVAAGFFTDWS